MPLVHDQNNRHREYSTASGSEVPLTNVRQTENSILTGNDVYCGVSSSCCLVKIRVEYVAFVDEAVLVRVGHLHVRKVQISCRNVIRALR